MYGETLTQLYASESNYIPRLRRPFSLTWWSRLLCSSYINQTSKVGFYLEDDKGSKTRGSSFPHAGNWINKLFHSFYKSPQHCRRPSLKS